MRIPSICHQEWRSKDWHGESAGLSFTFSFFVPIIMALAWLPLWSLCWNWWQRPAVSLMGRGAPHYHWQKAGWIQAHRWVPGACIMAAHLAMLMNMLSWLASALKASMACRSTGLMGTGLLLSAATVTCDLATAKNLAVSHRGNLWE